jgi:hypothetical protein
MTLMYTGGEGMVQDLYDLVDQLGRLLGAVGTLVIVVFAAYLICRFYQNGRD